MNININLQNAKLPLLRFLSLPRNFLKSSNKNWFWLFFFFLRFYLFNFREGKGKRRRRKREMSMCGCLSCAPYWGPGLQPRHVPWLGIELVTIFGSQPTLNPLSYTSQGKSVFFSNLNKLGTDTLTYIYPFSSLVEWAIPIR